MIRPRPRASRRATAMGAGSAGVGCSPEAADEASQPDSPDTIASDRGSEPTVTGRPATHDRAPGWSPATPGPGHRAQRPPVRRNTEAFRHQTHRTICKATSHRSPSNVDSGSALGRVALGTTGWSTPVAMHVRQPRLCHVAMVERVVAGVLGLCCGSWWSLAAAPDRAGKPECSGVTNRSAFGCSSCAAAAVGQAPAACRARPQ
jgi:hypothetical protein